MSESAARKRGDGRDAAVDLLAWTTIISVGAGLIEGLTLALQDAQGFIPWVNASVLWRAPYANALYVVGVALPLAVVAWWRPSVWRLCMTVPAALTALGLVFFATHYRLSFGAQVALSLGLGYTAADLLDRRRVRWQRGSRKALGVLVAVPLVPLFAIPLFHERTEQAALEALPQVPGRPNVLLVVLDAVRAQSLGLYGYDRPTSATLDRLGAQGVVFERAYSTAPWTLPSHASMFTGQWPYELDLGWQRGLGEDAPLLAEVMQSSGYRTGGFTGNLLYTTRASGLARGFAHYEAIPNSLRQFLLGPSLAQLTWQRHRGVRSQRRLIERKFSEGIARGFLDWVGSDTTRPYFAFLNLYDAHAPTRPSQRWRNRFRSGNAAIDGYDASIAMQDEVLGQMLDTLDARGLLSRTVVVVTADHGELLGEYGLTGHGNSLYDVELHVPLVIRGAPVPQGTRVKDPVSLRDLPATILRLAKVSGSPLPGVSLSSLWDTSAATERPSPAYAEVAPPPNVAQGTPLAGGQLRSVILGSYQAIQHADGRLELYHLARAPRERLDLARDPAHADTLAALSRVLDSLRRRP